MEQDPGQAADETKQALTEAVERDGGALIRFAVASVGTAGDGTALVVEVLRAGVRGGQSDLERARLFEALRRRCAQHVDRERRRGAPSAATGFRARLGEVRPTEREALLLRYVAGLGLADLAAACGTDEALAKERISRGLVHLCRLGAPPGAIGAREAPPEKSGLGRRVEEQLADVVDGLAPGDLADFVSNDDVARDLVHDAERLVGELRGLEADIGVDLPQLEADAFAEGREAVPAAPAAKVAAEAVHEEAAPVGEATERVPAVGSAPMGSADGAESPSAAGAAQVDKTPPPAHRGQRASWSERFGPRGRLAVAAGVAALLGIFAFAASRSRGGERVAGEAWSGKLSQVTRAFGGVGGIERCSPDHAVCSPIERGDELPAGSTVRTDGRTRVVIDLKDGTRVALDRSSEIAFDGAYPRRARLERGSLVAEVPELGTSRARFDVPLGFVETEAAKASLDVDANRVIVEVVRGAARLVDMMERGVGVHAGEEGRLEPGAAPVVSPTSVLGGTVLWTERAFLPATAPEQGITGLGELRAKKPSEDKERKGAVVLASHTTKVRIVGSVARTEVEEEFKNGTDDVLEGIYRFPLPPDAQIERLALDVDGKLEEGAFVDRERAAAIWRGAIVNAGAKKPVEEIVWVPGPWRDPALLEWQRGGRFELRIFPIPKRGSRRVLLAYTQVVPPSGSLRRYLYPLPHDPSGSTKVGRFEVDVQVRGHEPKRGVRAKGYDLRHESLPEGAEALHFVARNFVPSGDLAVEFSPANGDSEMIAWAYQPGPGEVLLQPSALTPAAKAAGNHATGKLPLDSAAASGGAAPDEFDASGAGYVAFAIRPKLPRGAEDLRRSFAVVVDSSRSMFGERYRRATELTVRLVREMDSRDVVTVLACDSICREFGPVGVPGGQMAARVEAFLRDITPEGGSDVAGAVRRARAALGSPGPSVARIVYIGDGTPTIGAIQPAFVRKETQAAMPDGDGTVTAVAVGADADVATLGVLADAGGGVVVPYSSGQSVGEASYAVLAATYGRALANVEVELPDGVVDVAPRRVANIPSGGEAIVVARLTRPVVEGTVRLRGKVGGAPFEQRYPLRVEATGAKGNAFVPRLWAAAKVAELEKEGDSGSRKRAVELSGRFHVASRYTSLLVLESDAMFRAFGLGRQDKVALWTGEDESKSAGADGEVEVRDAPDAEDSKGFDSPAKERLDDAFAKKDESALGSASGSGLGALGSSGGQARRSAARKPSAYMDPPAAAEPATPNPYAAEESGPSGGAFAPAPPKPKAAAPMATARPRDQMFNLAPSDPFGDAVLARPPPPPPRRRMIPMRKIWERVGRIVTPAELPSNVSAEAISRAERDVESDDLRRDGVRKLYTLLFVSGNIERAAEVAERWSAKDPLDPDALTARADVAAARGERDLAIRILGSVVDVRPGDHKAQWRLARLHRWAGRAELGCRHSMAVAQIRLGDAKLLAEAVRCERDVGHASAASDLLSLADEPARRGAETLLQKPEPDPSVLSGDFRLEATWDRGDDLDLAMIGPDGARVSWLGAPTKAVITARDVSSSGREGLALRGASPGDYVIELVRPSGHRGAVRGSVDIVAAGDRRKVPFVLDGDRVQVALVKMTTRSKLVPL